MTRYDKQNHQLFSTSFIVYIQYKVTILVHLK